MAACLEEMLQEAQCTKPWCSQLCYRKAALGAVGCEQFSLSDVQCSGHSLVVRLQPKGGPNSHRLRISLPLVF